MTVHSTRDIVVVGASAGGVDALNSFLGNLPANLPASVLVVLHLSKTGSSALPRVLDRAGSLQADVPKDAERLKPGRVYVAPPDRHLLVVDDAVRLSTGLHQNGHRPALDALFFSAARYADTRVIGIVLSGTLDDGAIGVATVCKRGGLAAVQDPEEAAYSDMPRNALLAAPGAVTLPVRDLARMVTRRAGEPVERRPEPPDPDLVEAVNSLLDAVPTNREPPAGAPVGLSCPSCDGPLYAEQDSNVTKYACLVGHTWSSQALFEHQSHVRENALRYAIRTLSERARLSERIVHSARERGHDRTARRFESSADEARQAIEVLSQVLRQQLGSEQDLLAEAAHVGDGP